MMLFMGLISANGEDSNKGKNEEIKLIVAVGGFVKNPGVYEYIEGATIYDMIVVAGGPSEFADMKRVDVTRDGKRAEYDMTQEKLRKSILAKPNDSINVPTTWMPAR